MERVCRIWVYGVGRCRDLHRHRKAVSRAINLQASRSLTCRATLYQAAHQAAHQAVYRRECLISRGKLNLESEEEYTSRLSLVSDERAMQPNCMGEYSILLGRDR